MMCFFLYPSIFTHFVSRTSASHCSTILLLTPSVRKLNQLAESHPSHDVSKDKYKNGIELDSESKENLQQISRVILKIHNRTVENVVRALQHDDSCSKLQLTSNLVDGLLHKFGDDWKSALGVFQWAKTQSGYKHTSHSFEKMVDILGKMKQMNQMLDIVKEMRKEGSVTVETIARVMRRLVAAGQWKDAINILDDLGSLGLDKNTETMNLLLDALCKEKKTEVARDVYLKLKAHVIPNAYTFNIFVNGWCNSRRIDEAIWTIQEMKGYGFHPSVVTYTTIIQAYCKQFKFSKVYDLLDEMNVNNCLPNIVTYTTIMSSLAKSSKYEAALCIVEKMNLSGCKPDTLFCNSLINILGKLGKIREASHIFEVEMQKEGVNRNLSTYNTMISVFCSHNREQDALDVLKEMENSYCRPDIQTYFPLLKLSLKSNKNVDQIRLLLSDIVDKHHLSLDLDAYTLLIHGLCNVGEIQWACNLFEEMTSRDIVPRIQTLKLLMDEANQKSIDGIVERARYLIYQFNKSRQQSLDLL